MPSSHFISFFFPLLLSVCVSVSHIRWLYKKSKIACGIFHVVISIVSLTECMCICVCLCISVHVQCDDFFVCSGVRPNSIRTLIINTFFFYFKCVFVVEFSRFSHHLLWLRSFDSHVSYVLNRNKTSAQHFNRIVAALYRGRQEKIKIVVFFFLSHSSDVCVCYKMSLKIRHLKMNVILATF